MEISLILLCNVLILITFNCLVTNVLILSIFWLISAYINSIILLFMLNMNLIGAILLIVYVGAIAILFIFSIMMINFIKVKNNTLSQYNVILVFMISLFLLLKMKNLSPWLNFFIDNYSTNNFFIIENISMWFYQISSIYIIVSSLSLLLPMIGVLNYK